MKLHACLYLGTPQAGTIFKNNQVGSLGPKSEYHNIGTWHKLTVTQLIILQSVQVCNISVKFMRTQLTTKVELPLTVVSQNFILAFLW